MVGEGGKYVVLFAPDMEVHGPVAELVLCSHWYVYPNVDPPVGAVDVSGAGEAALQIICEALTVGAVNGAYTVSVAVTIVEHPVDVIEFIVNVTTVEVIFVLVKVPVIEPFPFVPIVGEVIPDGVVRDQLDIVPTGSAEAAIGVNATPLHSACINGVTVTKGLTVTVTVIAVPVHPFADGVIV